MSLQRALIRLVRKTNRLRPAGAEQSISMRTGNYWITQTAASSAPLAVRNALDSRYEWCYVWCMAKRGEKRPWKVIYQWESGIKGTEAKTSEDEARMLAERIQRNADARDMRVSVTIAYRP